MDGTSPVRNVTNTPIVHTRDHPREEDGKPFSLEDQDGEEAVEDLEERHVDEPIGPPDEDEAGQRLDLRA